MNSVITILCALTLISETQLISRRNSFDQVSHKGAFLQLPFSNPPTVRPPPYSESSEQCPETNVHENWVGTLCGDLNTGFVPLNPFGHKFRNGGSYPFDIIKNKTLQFFRHALPVLRNDKSLPKVARFNPHAFQQNKRHQSKRSLPPVNDVTDDSKESDKLAAGLIHLSDDEDETQFRGNRGIWQNQMALANRFCENPQPKGSLICKFYNAMWGKSKSSPQIHHPFPSKQKVNQKPHYFPNSVEHQADPLKSEELQQQQQHSAESKTSLSLGIDNSGNIPATPCPSSAEYLTPVFARNHEGAWRYVVQIPREGYFTQTVEVTKCSETNCFFIDGSCRTSPRWQSLLVAEMFYPEVAFPVTQSLYKSPPEAFNQYTQKKFAKRNGKNGNDIGQTVSSEPKPIPLECDGMDQIGCFQVRLFYDWFLIPGSCNCWKRQFDFTKVHQS